MSPSFALVVGLLSSLTYVALQFDEHYRAAKWFDLAAVGVCGLLTIAALSDGGPALPVLISATGFYFAFRTRHRSVRPLLGWSGLVTLGSSPWTAATLSTSLTLTTIGTVAAAFELSRSDRWDRPAGRLLLLAILVCDLPLSLAVVSIGDEIVLPTSVLASETTTLSLRVLTLLATGFLLSGLVRLGLIPLAGWLYDLGTRRPAWSEVSAGVSVILVLPPGLWLIEKSRVVGTDNAMLSTQCLVAAICSGLVLLVVAVGLRSGLLASSALTLVLVAFVSLMPLPSDWLPLLVYVAAAFCAVFSSTRGWLHAGCPRARSGRMLTTTKPLLELPLGFASNLVRFLDWAAVRQSLTWLPRLSQVVTRRGTTVGWALVFGLLALSVAIR